MLILSKIEHFNADTFSPVGVYMSLRDHYRKPCLLESNSHYDRSNSKSLIGLEPLVEIELLNKEYVITELGEERKISVDKDNFTEQLDELIASYDFENKHFMNGFFAYSGFELASFVEQKVEIKERQLGLPFLHLIIFKYIIVLDHFNDEGLLVENTTDVFTDCFDNIYKKINFRGGNSFPFSLVGEETSTTLEEEFKQRIDRSIQHCERGDVFQLVLSRRFQQKFVGEDFEIYRQLRRTNPSPYLFYFDFESHRLMGSSPEAQLVVHDGEAEIHPIAGTVKKSGDREKDKAMTQFLINDEKENAEHTMLVDLARNDLSKHCSHVKVDRYKDVQFFSHVIHLVSKVKGRLKGNKVLPIYLDTFPAGTLSGTPKPKALELISNYEPHAREFYGGGIGFIGVNGNLNMAIVIRSILSKNNQLYYQAGAGVVLDSNRDAESQEVHNKLNALRTAINLCDEQSISSPQTTTL